MKYYLVGIKGTGMSALALCLKDMGEMVIGSDKDETYFKLLKYIDSLLKNDIFIAKTTIIAKSLRIP